MIRKIIKEQQTIRRTIEDKGGWFDRDDLHINYIHIYFMYNYPNSSIISSEFTMEVKLYSHFSFSLLFFGFDQRVTIWEYGLAA